MKPTILFTFLLLAPAAIAFAADSSSPPTGTAPASSAPANSPPASPVPYRYSLAKQGLTSAGIYTLNGRLVRVLWTMQDTPSGSHTGTWDGLDQLGKEAPPGDYRFHLLVNRSIYRNVGAIGNSGLPPNAAGHTPAGMMSVAVDPAGGIYTANGWDEAGADFKKWNPEGKSIYDANFEIRNGNPNGMPYSITTDDQYIYCGVGGWASNPWNERQQVQRFRISDGKLVEFTGKDTINGHINIYEWPSKKIPRDTPENDASLMTLPLRALAVTGDTILAADSLGGRVLRYQKTTGDSQGEFPVPLPRALAVDPQGQIWVGHQHHLVSVFSPEGKEGRQVISDVGEVEALAFGPGGLLYLADSGAGQVKIYNVAGSTPTLVRTLGQKAQPGDRAPDHFFRLAGVAVGRQGQVVTIQDEPISGARVAKWTPDGKLLWEQFGSEFVSLGNYGVSHPELFYTMSFHRDRLTNPNTGAWEYLGDAFPGGTSYHSDTHGVPRVVRLGKQEFFYTPTGDGVQVYRIEGGVLHLAASVGGSSPSPDGAPGKSLGQWSWHDASGSGQPAAGDILWYKKPGEGHYSVFGTDVDLSGNIWFANTTTHSIWEIPVGKPDSRGNPTYSWANAREAIPQDKSPLGFDPTMVQHSSDGSCYAFGWSKTWPSPHNNPFWMGGTTLARFDKDGSLIWAAALPGVCVGLDLIPGGGCMVGLGNGARIYHFSRDGLMIGMMAPGEAMGKQSGWMDNHASVAVNRNPKDHLLDIFAEDDYVDRIGWYRVDDRNIEAQDERLVKR